MNVPVTEKELAEYVRQLFNNGQWDTQEMPLSSTIGRNAPFAAAQKPGFRIEVSDDRMEVRLTLNVSPGDRKPEPQEILEEIRSLGVQAEIDNAALDREVRDPSGVSVVLARGRPPVDGADSWLKWDGNLSEAPWRWPEEGPAQARSPLRIPYVKKGERIGSIQPQRAGAAGFDVFGTVISPIEAREIRWKEGDGVRFLGDGSVAALADGRPRVRGECVKVVDICPSFIIHGDVSPETGHVVFTGDVIVLGSVNESMAIETLGNVYVYGNVCGARILTNGCIYVQGNIIRSVLKSGQSSLALAVYTELSSRFSRRLGAGS